MFHIAICDDEQSAIDIIIDYLSIYRAPFSVLAFNSAESLYEHIDNKNQRIDILICDILLDNHNGIDVSEIVKQKSPWTQIIFISAYLSNRIDVYRVAHVYFIPKPIKRELLFDALEKAAGYLDTKRKNSILIRVSKSSKRILLDDIVFIEQWRRILHIHTKDEKYSVYLKLDELMEQLDKRFFRCHQSYVVNFDYVLKKNKVSFTMIQNAFVPISRKYELIAQTCFVEYVGGQI